MTGIEVSACGLRRIVLLRPTMVDDEAKRGVGDGEREAAGVFRTEMIWLVDGQVVEVLRSEEDPRVILGKRTEGRYIEARSWESCNGRRGREAAEEVQKREGRLI